MKVEVALIEVAVGCVGVIVGEEVDAAAGAESGIGWWRVEDLRAGSRA